MNRTSQAASSVSYIADPHSIARFNGGRRVAFDLLPESYRQGKDIIKLSAAASAAATSIAVDALTVALPVGTNLYFGQAAEFVRVTAPAAKGATTVTVEALGQALEDNDEATFGDGEKQLLPGTVMVVVAAGDYAGQRVPRAVRPAAEVPPYVHETMARENAPTSEGFGAIVGGVLFETLMPDATGSPLVLPGAYKTELKANGAGFVFQTYSDSRAV